MANGKRLHLLELLAQSERPVEQLARAAGLRMASVSSHLQILNAAGFVRKRRQGSAIFYRLSGAEVADLFVSMKAVGLTQLPALRATVGNHLAGDGETTGTAVPMTGTAVPMISRLDVLGAQTS